MRVGFGLVVAAVVAACPIAYGLREIVELPPGAGAVLPRRSLDCYT